MGRKNFRRMFGKSNVMYCVRVLIRFIGDDEPTAVYLRFRSHAVRGEWTQDIREAKFWLYKTGAYDWLNMKNPHLTGEVLVLHRDNDMLQAQKGMR